MGLRPLNSSAYPAPSGKWVMVFWMASEAEGGLALYAQRVDEVRHKQKRGPFGNAENGRTG